MTARNLDTRWPCSATNIQGHPPMTCCSVLCCSTHGAPSCVSVEWDGMCSAMDHHSPGRKQPEWSACKCGEVCMCVVGSMCGDGVCGKGVCVCMVPGAISGIEQPEWCVCMLFCVKLYALWEVSVCVVGGRCVWGGITYVFKVARMQFSWVWDQSAHITKTAANLDPVHMITMVVPHVTPGSHHMHQHTHTPRSQQHTTWQWGVNRCVHTDAFTYSVAAVIGPHPKCAVPNVTKKLWWCAGMCSMNWGLSTLVCRRVGQHCSLTLVELLTPMHLCWKLISWC